MGNKKVIIIGGGIAGLSAGCYLQMNGYDTEIFELHSIPGGLCTGWKRKGYTFDGCIHWLCGSDPRDELYTIWEELGAIQDKKIVNHEIYIRTDLQNDKSFSAYTDVDKLKEELLKFGSEDRELIEDLIDGINIVRKSNMPVLKSPDLYNMFDGLKFAFKELPLIRLMSKWKKVSLADLQRKFKSPILNQNFVRLFGMPDDMPSFALIYTLALLANNDAGYPIGGSLDFAKSIEKRYLSLGGKVNYNSRVEKIIVEDNKSKGIRLNNGKEYYSDIVISAADGHYTIYNMLDGKYIDEEIEGYYKNFPLFHPIIQISLGVARKFDNISDAITTYFPLEEPIFVDSKNTLNTLGIKIFNYDPTLAPEGKTAVVTVINADYEYWVNLKKDNPQKYNEEKDRIARSVINALDKKYGKIKDNIDIYDVATPDTFVRYTNNWMGSFEGFIPTVDTFGKKLKKTLPGLDNFYMIGQWVQPGGGLPTGGMHGRYITQLICKKDGLDFKATKQ
jgi:phytoene dehydrogenase-like protein